MHTLNSTCIKKCLPRGTECPVLWLNKCHMSYAMYSILYPYSTCSLRLNRLSIFLSIFFFFLSKSLTLYQYLKCNLSPPFQSEWLLWRLHWKVAGLVKQKLPLKSYFYRRKLNFVSNVFYLINGTKEAKIFAIVLRWQGHWVTVYNIVLIICNRPTTVSGYDIWFHFFALFSFSVLYNKHHFIFIFNSIFVSVFYLIRKLFLVPV